MQRHASAFWRQLIRTRIRRSHISDSRAGIYKACGLAGSATTLITDGRRDLTGLALLERGDPGPVDEGVQVALCTASGRCVTGDNTVSSSLSETTVKCESAGGWDWSVLCPLSAAGPFICWPKATGLGGRSNCAHSMDMELRAFLSGKLERRLGVTLPAFNLSDSWL